MISFKITTYGRVSTLEETLFSFLNQTDLEDAECVIVNDYCMQTLVFDHPKVRIINLEEQFPTIGEKENFAVEQCKGDIIAVTDDDDIYLKNHISNIKKYFVPGTNILHWKGCFYNEPEISSIVGIGNSGMVYSKKAWWDIGKHPVMNAGGDSVFSVNVHRLGGVVNAEPADAEVSAFYRWSVRGSDNNGIYHQSGQGTDTPDRQSIIQRHGAHIEQLRREKKIPTGIINLKPNWKYDYQKMLDDYLNKNYGLPIQTH